MKKNIIKLVVYKEHTLGYINPKTPKILNVLKSSLLKGAPFEMNPGSKNIFFDANIRIATIKDLEDFGISPKGYIQDNNYLLIRNQ